MTYRNNSTGEAKGQLFHIFLDQMCTWIAVKKGLDREFAVRLARYRGPFTIRSVSRLGLWLSQIGNENLDATNSLSVEHDPSTVR